MSWLRSSLLVLALSFVAAPAAAKRLDPWYAKPGEVFHADCPERGTIQYVARSEDGPEDARAIARSRVAKQINSTLTSEVERVVNIVSSGKSVQREKSFKEEIVETSEFRHAHLIRDDFEVGKRRKEYFALACLDRKEAAAAVRGELGEVLPGFDGAAKRAIEAADAARFSDFTIALTQAERRLPEVLVVLAQLSAIGRQRSGEEAGVREQWARLQRAASRMRQEISISLAVSAPDLPPEATSQLTDGLRNAFSELGLDATGSLGSCSGVLSHVARVEAVPNCRWGDLGHSCAPAVTVEGQPCANGSSKFNLVIQGRDLRGVDGRSAELALKKALRKFTSERMRSQLVQALSGLLPLAQ